MKELPAKIYQYESGTVTPRKPSIFRRFEFSNGTMKEKPSNSIYTSNGFDIIYTTLGKLKIVLAGTTKVVEGGTDALEDGNGVFMYEVNISLNGSNIRGIDLPEESFKAKISFTYQYRGIDRIRLNIDGSSSNVKQLLRENTTSTFLYEYFLLDYNKTTLTIRCDVSLRGTIKFTAEATIFAEVGYSPSTTNIMLNTSQNIVQIYLSSDIYTGENLAQCIMASSNNKQISQYLSRVVNYIKGLDCTLSGKVLKLDNTNQVLNTFIRISIYVVLRYYLWYLIRDIFTLGILKNRYTKLFLRVLSKSEYSNFVSVFESPLLQDVDEYFIY